MRWFGLGGMNNKFKHAFAYLSQEDFKKAKVMLNSEF
jgi:hypothetical protein